MKLMFLGTASGLPTHDRFSQTVVLEIDKTLHLIDVGDAASSLLAQSKLNHQSIRSIVVSHMHADHHAGLAQVLKTSMHLKKDSDLKIVLPSEGINAVVGFLEACYLPLEWLKYPVEMIPIGDEEIVIRDNLTMNAYPNTHLLGLKGRSFRRLDEMNWQFQSYSFVINAQGRRIVYSGNLRGKLAEIDELIDQNTILITEMAHLRIDEMLDVISQRKPKHVYITHFYPYLDMDDVKQKITDSSFGEAITLTWDGMVVEL
ncbi:MAG: MBL fold metallo-hydrolase [Firmicutes bacterium]|nr:MBL fold metallo-hydrolase [Bacillota bacterium]